MKLAFVGYKKQERYSIGSPKDEDKVLLDLFSSKGLDVEQVVWNDPVVKWERYQKAIVKSPWDYHEFFSEFSSWLDKMDTLGITLLNPSEIIRTNSDKHYMKDIADSGLGTVPSRFLEKGTRPKLWDYFTELKTEKLVVKPCISASAKNTFVVSPENLGESEDSLHTFLQTESFLVQPFVEEIRNGELSFIFLGGKYSHSVLKLPKAGDFRVQHFHGGTIRVFEPSQEQIHVAWRYVDQFAKGCLYARVDGLMINNSFQLMELELIEPYLFLDTSEGAYQRYYESLIRLI